MAPEHFHRRTRGNRPLVGRADPRRSIIVQTVPRHALDPTGLSPRGPRRAVVVPRRLADANTNRTENNVVVARPAVARRAVIDVDIVIVSHDARNRVLACLDSLLASADGAVLSVTVVDTGSKDGTGEAVAARQDGARVIDMGMDTGLATAGNAGMARGHGRYVLLLDPDVTLTPGSLRTLVEFADRHPEAGAVAPRLLGPTDPADPQDTSAVEVDRVSGRAMLVPRVVHAATAGFDEDYFSSWADLDWCRRIRAAGYSLWCLPTATAIHRPTRPEDPDRRRAAVRDFHAGAYRYWRKHDAPPLWSPWHWAKAGLLATRGGLAATFGRDLPVVVLASVAAGAEAQRH